MVESALFFVIGFLCAAMLAIFAAPAVSRRAMRLANARARLQAPLSEAQARAERDALRAIHTVEIFKMERKVEAAEWDRAIAKTEYGRQTNHMMKLDEAARALGQDIRVRDARIEEIEAAGRALEAESSLKDIALWDLTAQRDALQDRLSASRATISALETQADRSRIEIAILATKVSALEFEMADLRSGKTPFGESVQGLEERLRRSEQAREAQTLELGRRMRQAAELEAALTAARDAMARTAEEAMRQQAPSGAIAASDSRAGEPAERERLQQRLDDALASVETMTKGDAALRLAIAKLGRDIVRARLPQDDEPHGEAQIVSFARREPIS